MTRNTKVITVLICAVMLFTSCMEQSVDLTAVEYRQEYYIEVNENVPEFEEDEITAVSFEQYSDLDALGRCGTALACIGRDIMPTEERGAIGQIKPSGWQLVKYDIVDGKYLYNRCHLIGYQLSGENANEKNLITGTRSMNVDGMLPFENMVADYIEETNNHVMYRVTPIYDEEALVARGVQMEGYSVEDKGKGISFNVFVFNSQPGIEINYKDGTSKLLTDSASDNKNENSTKSKKTVDKHKKKVYNMVC